MKALIQRVTYASVSVDGKVISNIGAGLLVMLGIDKDDNEEKLDRLVHKVVRYRVFSDEDGKMNLSLLDIKGELLVVSQFTLSGDTRKGMRPSFSSAAPPEIGKKYYEQFIFKVSALIDKVGAGQFGSDMKLQLLNDGPVTFLLEV